MAAMDLTGTPTTLPGSATSAGSTAVADPDAAKPGRRHAGAGGAAAAGRLPTVAFWPRERTARRLSQLAVGLLLYGISEAMQLLPAVGVGPWDVLSTGVARLTGISLGTMLIYIGVGVLLLWIPLRQRPGLGTLSNIVAIGSVVDIAYAVAPTPHALWLRWTVFLGGVLLNAVATGMYIGAGLGPGPRDGLTTGFAARGHSVRVVRTSVEVSVLVIGWLLGGNVGLGTVVFALGIGPLVHHTIPFFARRPSDRVDAE
ncbi:MAG TPA: hypothetical protein VGX23_31410 [Actinocrinis sp.]|nr:hypothetical protein [Actinocrinis sp.]